MPNILKSLLWPHLLIDRADFFTVKADRADQVPQLQGGQVMRVLGVFQNFYAVIFIMRLCGYPHNFVSWFATFCKNSFNFTQFESLFTYNWIDFCNFFGDSKYKKHLRIIVYHPYHFFKDFTNQRTAILLYHLHIPIILR